MLQMQAGRHTHRERESHAERERESPREREFVKNRETERERESSRERERVRVIREDMYINVCTHDYESVLHFVSRFSRKLLTFDFLMLGISLLLAMTVVAVLTVSAVVGVQALECSNGLVKILVVTMAFCFLIL